SWLRTSRHSPLSRSQPTSPRPARAEATSPRLVRLTGGFVMSEHKGVRSMKTTTINGTRRKESPYAMTWTHFFQRAKHPSVRPRVKQYIVEVNGDRHDVIVLDVHGRVV